MYSLISPWCFCPYQYLRLNSFINLIFVVSPRNICISSVFFQRMEQKQMDEVPEEEQTNTAADSSPPSPKVRKPSRRYPSLVWQFIMNNLSSTMCTPFPLFFLSFILCSLSRLFSVLYPPFYVLCPSSLSSVFCPIPSIPCTLSEWFLLCFLLYTLHFMYFFLVLSPLFSVLYHPFFVLCPSYLSSVFCCILSILWTQSWFSLLCFLSYLFHVLCPSSLSFVFCPIPFFLCTLS